MGDHAGSSTSFQDSFVFISGWSSDSVCGITLSHEFIDITIRLNAYRQLRSVRLSINDDEKDVVWEEMGKGVLNASFEPLLYALDY